MAPYCSPLSSCLSAVKINKRAAGQQIKVKQMKSSARIYLRFTFLPPSTGLVLLLPVARNTALLQEGGGFCVDGCFVCLLTPAGAEPGAEGVAAGAGRRAAHRLARLRGHEEGRRSLRWAGLRTHAHMHSHTQVLLKSINSFTGLCLSLKQRESILRLQRGSKIKHC